VSLANLEFMKGLEALCASATCSSLWTRSSAVWRVRESCMPMSISGGPRHHDPRQAAGGRPTIGATVVGPRVWPEIQPGEHASTFGGGPFVTGVACGVFELLSDPAFVRSVEEKGAHLREGLNALAGKYSSVKEIREPGSSWGRWSISRPPRRWSISKRSIISSSAARANVVRFIPPLVVSDADIDRALDAFGTFLSKRAK